LISIAFFATHRSSSPGVIEKSRDLDEAMTMMIEEGRLRIIRQSGGG